MDRINQTFNALQDAALHTYTSYSAAELTMIVVGCFIVGVCVGIAFNRWRSAF